MRISVTFLDEQLRRAALRIEPSWWRRWLLGAEETDEIILAVTGLNGGTIWIRDSSGRRIREQRIVDEIDHAYTIASAALRVRALLTRAT